MSNQAIKIISPGNAEIVDAEIPQLPADDYILVRVTAVAVNPTDWKHVDWADRMPCVGSWVGCDYAGIVDEVGPGVTKDFKEGDRICGPVNGSNGCRETDGAFANWIHVKGDVQIKTPDNITDEQAATLGIAVCTVGQGLYRVLGLPLPYDDEAAAAAAAAKGEPTTVFIYGGSTAMGISGIQYAKLSGARVLTTSSPANYEYVKSLGADEVFDYKSPGLVDDVRAATGGGLTLAWDCHSTDESAAVVARVLSKDKGAVVGTLLPVDKAKMQAEIGTATAAADLLRVEVTLMYSIFNEEYTYGGRKVTPPPEEHVFAERFWELSRRLLVEGKVKPIKVIRNRGGEGLEGVLEGMRELKAGKVSAGKLVYTMDE